MTFDYISLFYLTLKAPITSAADDKYGDNFPNFWKNKVWYHALKAAKFEIVVCCKL